MVVYLVRKTLTTGLIVVGPLLVAGMVVGLLLAIFQAVTSIRDSTLNMIPKILTVAGLLVWILPWILSVITAYTTEMLYTLRDLGP
jgi:flagellar biosynthetic protein FliQ